jgi:hypothetical protein
MMQAVMTITPSAAARTGANYDESALVLHPPIVLGLAHELECQLTDRAEMHGDIFVQTASLEQLLGHPYDRRGRRPEAEVAVVVIRHSYSDAQAIAPRQWVQETISHACAT